MELGAFLQTAASRQFSAGRHDCGLWLADWIQFARGGDDLCPELRGIAQSEWLRKARRLPNVANRVFTRAGLSRTKEPKPGDIAVLRCESVFAGAIKTTNGWAVLSTAGVLITPLPPKWRVCVAWSARA